MTSVSSTWWAGSTTKASSTKRLSELTWWACLQGTTSDLMNFDCYQVDGREGWFKYLPRLLFFPVWLRPSLRSRLEPVPPRWWKSGERTPWWTSRWPSSCSRLCWWSGASTSRRRLTRWWSWAWRWPATSASRRSSTSRAQNLDEDNELLNPKVLQGFRQCSYPRILWGKSWGR